MLIYTNPTEVLDCIKGGLKFLLNVGNMSKTSDNKKITQGVAVSDKDIESFRKLVDLGVNTEIHMVPNHKPEPIMNYL